MLYESSYYGIVQMDDVIEHHGIQGQRWGQRNGPPYPLGTTDYSKKELKYANKEVKRKNKDLKRGIRSGDLREAHTIPRGTTMFRTSIDENETGSGSTYVSYLDVDRDHYKGGWVRKTGGADTAYEHEYTLKEDLKIPSRLELQSVITNIVSKNEKYIHDTVNTHLDMLMPKDSDERRYASMDEITQMPSLKKWREFVKNEENNFRNMTVSEAYYYTAQTLGTNNKVKNDVINELKKRGYNAITDEASVGGQGGWWREGGDPLILFDRSILSEPHTKQISREEEVAANDRYKKWASKNERSKRGTW